MSNHKVMSAVIAGILSMSCGLAIAADQQRDRDQDQTQKQAQDEEQIFGRQLMTEGEMKEHRNKMRAAKTEKEREQIRKEHHERMQVRAKERGVTLPEEPPARSTGPGAGTGPGSGMGAGGGMGSGGGRNR